MSDPQRRIDRILTHDEQQAVTPDEVIAVLYAENARFITDDMTRRDHRAQVRAAVAGQWPKASCCPRTIAPSIDEVAGFEARNTKNFAFVHAIAEQNVRCTFRRIRDESAALRDLDARGAIRIVGGVCDMATGKVTPI